MGPIASHYRRGTDQVETEAMSTIYSDGIKVEFAGTVLRQRDDGLYWLTAEHQTIGYGSTIGLYLCRKTAKRDTYEWLSFRDTGYKFLTLADASEAATALETDARMPAKSLDALVAAEG